jgi:phosphonate transport system substrate-binding protein
MNTQSSQVDKGRHYIKILVLGGWLICILMLGGACGPQGETQKREESVLRIGVLPELSRQKDLIRYQPLLTYLARELGIPCEIVPSSTYAELLGQFHNGKIDLAHFGGITFVQAHKSDQAIPLVMRHVDSQFTSYFLVSTENPAQTLEGLKGATFSFGSRLSTSGHFMPRYFMEKKGIRPEQFFKDIQYSGKHDKTALWVQEGKVEVGVANSRIVRALFENGALKKEKTRILWETPPYSDYVWAVHPALSDALQNRIRDAFLKLDPENPNNREILKSVQAGKFLPAGLIDFMDLIKIHGEMSRADKDQS